jgi:hypothetical protein
MTLLASGHDFAVFNEPFDLISYRLREIVKNRIGIELVIKLLYKRIDTE